MLKTNNRLFCFSPPVMLATFAIELCLLFWVVWKHKLNPITRLVAPMLLFLASFQLAEYMICGGLGLKGVEWSRFGYVSITILPPLGLHLAAVIAKKKVPWLIALAYASAAAFIYFFVFVTNSMTGEECRANYVVFHVDDVLVWFYVLYYYGWLLTTIWLSLAWAKTSKLASNLRWLAASYAVFIIPVTVANIAEPSTTAGIPSLMCGFAVLTALLLVLKVIPRTRVAKPKKKA